jgi:3',5'-cyclic AMP phosphodiesterase CpdA
MTLISVLIAAMSILSSWASAQTPLRGPYFVNASSTSAWVCWRWTAQSPGACKELGSLTPGAEIKYGISSSSAEWTARALPAQGAPIRFAAIGDSGDGGPAQLQVAQVLTRWDPDFVIHTGDIVYPSGKDKHYDARFFHPYRTLLAKVPLFPSLGNHDYGYAFLKRPSQRTYAKSYKRIFRRPKYYTFNAGPAQFFSLDTNKEGASIKPAASILPGSRQYRWLKRELAVSTAAWKIVFLHVPVYTAKDHGDHETVREALEPLFTRYGVDVVFQGHNHYYERTSPRKGVTYVTTGTGGSGLYSTGGKRPWSNALLSEYGFVAVALDDKKLTLDMVDVSGRILDHHIITHR